MRSWNHGGFVEVGYFIGYFHDISTCRPEERNYPRVFAFADFADSSYRWCKVFPLADAYPHEESFDHFTLSDSNANTVYNVNFNGDYLQSIDVDFSRGWNSAAMERGEYTDSCYARWTNLYAPRHRRLVLLG